LKLLYFLWPICYPITFHSLADGHSQQSSKSEMPTC